jgi:hypothetical protein
MNSLRILFVLAATLISSQANAISGNELAQSCRGQEENSRWGFCVGYVVGVIDQSRESEPPLCVPAEAIQSQVARVVTKWIEANPDKLHFSANSLVYAALNESFTCRRQNTTRQ